MKFDIELILGDYTHCGKWWTTDAAAIDLCFKLYSVKSGNALMQFGQAAYTLEAGNIYLINGYKLSRQCCDDYFDVFWLHFNPVGINPRMLSLQLPALYKLELTATDTIQFDEAVREVFVDRCGGLKSIASNCRILATINLTLARLLNERDEGDIVDWKDAFGRLKTAIDYMDTHFTENPPLWQLAELARLAPNYFHRYFKRVVGISPYEYMLKKRLNKAKYLLSNTDLAVYQVALECGYENSYYFSRTFKKNTGKTPSMMQKNSPV